MVSFFAKTLFENFFFLSKKRVSLEPTSNHQHSVFPKTDELLICNEIKENFFEGQNLINCKQDPLMAGYINIYFPPLYSHLYQSINQSVNNLFTHVIF